MRYRVAQQVGQTWEKIAEGIAKSGRKLELYLLRGKKRTYGMIIARKTAHPWSTDKRFYYKTEKGARKEFVRKLRSWVI